MAIALIKKSLDDAKMAAEAATVGARPLNNPLILFEISSALMCSLIMNCLEAQRSTQGWWNPQQTNCARIQEFWSDTAIINGIICRCFHCPIGICHD